MRRFNESVVEGTALEWLDQLGYKIIYGEEVAPDSPTPERTHYGEVILTRRLQDALRRLNPTLPEEALDEARRRLTVPQTASLLQNNRAFHRMLVDGVDVEYRASDGSIKGGLVRVVDFSDPESRENEFLAINQFTVIEAGHNRRPDIVLFINGLPLTVIELKNAADENATIWSAFNQLQTYKAQIPSLFTSNELLIISDGIQARLGSLTADRERFMPWRTVDGRALAPNTTTELQTLLQGVCQKTRLLEYVQGFITFEENGAEAVKILAAYHQYHAVGVAVAETVKAAHAGGDRRGGVIWHTQGSGKSLTMAFYAGRIIRRPEMSNPTLVVLTDRNDLDDQLFGTFSRAQDLLHQIPEQAQSRDDLKRLLRVAAGGVVFTTIQKFSVDGRGTEFPRLSDRGNIIVIADEAHRSQYDFIDGFARHLRDALPNATFIGFTGTPIESAERSTLNIFGDYISVYDIKRAVTDGATVPLYYEGRVAKLDLKPEELPRIDPDFEEVTEDAEAFQKEKVKRKWSQLAAMVGTPKRLGRVAADLVDHFERRQEAMEGKAMIVAMSRRIAVDIYNQIVAIRPEWHTDDDATGAIKIVMTGSASDDLDMQPHIRNKAGRDALAQRLKDPDDPLKLVIVRDMWLTGFDAPPLHTLYVDKPMQGHTLMQAIARVNRVFRDKPGGLIVDYLGLADELKAALALYTQSGGQGDAVLDQKQAAGLMMKQFEICRDMFHGFDYTPFKSGSAAAQLTILAPAQEHILRQQDGKSRFLDATLALSKAFALAVAHEDTFKVRDDVAFFQTVRSVLAKTQTGGSQSSEQMHHAVHQIVANAVTSGQVVDIFAAAGLDRPDVSILSDDFLAEVGDLPHKNLAVETLRKLLLDQIKSQSRSNVVQSRKFSEMLAETIRAYQNRSLETAQIILELIAMAKAIRDAGNRGEQLGLTSDELAFYDALSENETAVEVLGDENLCPLARALVAQVRANTSIDWNVKESVRSDLRRLIKRTLRKYGYPPDKREEATKTILEQAEALAAHWA